MAILKALIMLCLVAMLTQLSRGAYYTVGGSNGGWDTSTNLQAWASSQKFQVGDNLVFQYPQNHDVIEVTKAGYDSCQASNPIQSSSDGDTTIHLSSPGKRYFICGVPGHCNLGMKVEIDTLASSDSASAPTPSSSTPADSPASPSVPADSPAIPLVPSEAPESTTYSPAQSPEVFDGVPLRTPFETRLTSPTLSPIIPSNAIPNNSPAMTESSQDSSAAAVAKGNSRAKVTLVFIFTIMLFAF